MTDLLREKTIALGGMFQALHLVQSIAHTGMADSAAMDSSLYSIFILDAETTEDVYGGIGGVMDGLRLMKRLFDGSSPQKDMEISRYIIAVMLLERKISRYPKLLANIAGGITQAASLKNQASLLDMSVIYRLAGIYEQNISGIKPQIIVNGEPAPLTNKDNAAKIRALLLACIRSAVLWRQKGGSRWQLFWSRKKLLKMADRLLKHPYQH